MSNVDDQFRKKAKKELCPKEKRIREANRKIEYTLRKMILLKGMDITTLASDVPLAEEDKPNLLAE